MRHSGFDCPVYGVLIPKNYKFEKDENGITWLVPPKGAEVPEELKQYCKESK